MHTWKFRRKSFFCLPMGFDWIWWYFHENHLNENNVDCSGTTTSTVDSLFSRIMIPSRIPHGNFPRRLLWSSHQSSYQQHHTLGSGMSFCDFDCLFVVPSAIFWNNMFRVVHILCSFLCFQSPCWTIPVASAHRWCPCDIFGHRLHHIPTVGHLRWQRGMQGLTWDLQNPLEPRLWGPLVGFEFPFGLHLVPCN